METACRDHLPDAVPAILTAQGTVDAPENITARNHHDTQLVFEYRAKYDGTLFVIGFTILWNAALIFSVLLDDGPAAYFTMPHTYVGWFLIYAVIVLLYNKTIIVATTDKITV